MTSARGLRVKKALLSLVAAASIAGVSQGAAHAADVPTQLTLSWLETCMTAGTVSLAVVKVGSDWKVDAFNLTPQ